MAKRLALFHRLPVSGCIFQALQPQGPVRGTQAAAAVAMP
ncbi:hypothetical protein GLGCALEP_04561 [Pseudomonas sp. MM221]|nr:hypothetical protein GLGCALEP_04561 [Pseudomonas sp. MM221]